VTHTALQQEQWLQFEIHTKILVSTISVSYNYHGFVRKQCRLLSYI